MKKHVFGGIAAGLGCAAIIIALLSGCAGTPSSAGASGPPPAWVTTPPSEDGENFYFIGSGSDAQGDAALARQVAGSDIVGGITRFLGVRITSDTTVEARDTLDTFESSLTSSIREESRAQIDDFRIVDTYTERRGDLVTVYLLGAYDRAALLQEQTRIRALFAEQQEAISGPEAEGDRLMGRGEFYQAAVRYIEAAVAASTSTVDNAPIRFERNMNKAREAVNRIQLLALTDNLNAMVGEQFPEPFRAKIAGGASVGEPGLPDVPVRVSYQEAAATGRPRVQSRSMNSDGEGIVSFVRPPANFVGTGTLTIALDLSSPLRSLETIPRAWFPQLEALEQSVNAKRVELRYTVESMAREIPTAIMILDLDTGGNLTGRSETSAGVLEALTAEGFNISVIPLQTELLRYDDAGIIQEIARQHGSRYDRLIFGNVSIGDFSESGSRVMVTVTGDIKAADLASGRILYSSGSRFKRALGSNAQSATSAAFKQFGVEVGEVMVNNLP